MEEVGQGNGVPGTHRAVSGSKRLLLVDDDAALREMLADQLARQGEFRTTAVGTGAEGLALAAAEPFDVIVLDRRLPDADGLDLCRQMRLGNVRCPIVILTDAGDAPIPPGPESGANECIVKPFRLGVLLARLRALIRQHERADDSELVIGPYTFLPSARMMINNITKTTIRLTEKETAILKYLYRCGNRVIKREILLDEVWGYNAGVTTHTVETHVYRLRKKIEPDPAEARILITEAGGYRLAT